MTTRSRRVLAVHVCALALVAAGGWAEPAAGAEPAACSADLTDFVLPCFEAYKADLQPFHHHEIDYMAQVIRDHVLTTGQRVDTIAIWGYGVLFKPDDPVLENSRKRAENVRSALAHRLRDLGLTLEPHQLVAEGMGDSHLPNQGTTQDQRWMLRRVQVFATYAADRPAKAKCVPDKEMVSRLKAFDKDYTDDGREHAVRCMADLLSRHYSCKEQNRSRYLHATSTTVSYLTGFVERFERGQKPDGDFACGGKKGEALKNCFGSLDRDIVESIHPLNERIIKFSIEAQASHVRALTECKYGRWILGQFEEEKASLYTCYPLQAQAFKVCRR
jgi:hypothetical protein